MIINDIILNCQEKIGIEVSGGQQLLLKWFTLGCISYAVIWVSLNVSLSFTHSIFNYRADNDNDNNIPSEIL